MSTEVIENFSAAIAAIQEAQEALVTATDHIEEHNIDEEAHADIRAMITDITSGDSIYSNAQIDERILEQLGTHTDENFKNAHPGWNDFETTLEERLAALTLRISTVEDKLDGRDQESSDLQIQLQAIENRYAPLLEQLSNALIAAQDAGSTDLADQYRTSIAATLEQKKDDLLACITEWQANHS